MTVLFSFSVGGGSGWEPGRNGGRRCTGILIVTLHNISQSKKRKVAKANNNREGTGTAVDPARGTWFVKAWENAVQELGK